MPAAILALVIASGQVGSVEVGGAATWYDYHEGQAAAGPTLRELLGPGWRGSLVTVTGPDGDQVTVRLTDWCLCTGGSQDRVIDLDRRDFARLADPSRGVITVTVELGATPTLPPTDTEPYWSWPGGGPR